jgi:hypothetical protein
MKTAIILFFATALLLTSCSKHKDVFTPPIPQSSDYLTGTWLEKDTTIQSIDTYSNYLITFRGDSFFLHSTFSANTYIANAWVAGTYTLISDSLNLIGKSTDTLYHPVPPLLNTFHETSFFRYKDHNKFTLTYPASNSFWVKYRLMVRQQ